MSLAQLMSHAQGLMFLGLCTVTVSRRLCEQPPHHDVCAGFLRPKRSYYRAFVETNQWTDVQVDVWVYFVKVVGVAASVIVLASLVASQVVMLL